VVRAQVDADGRVHARQAAARHFDLFVFASEAVHIRRRATHIGNGAREALGFIADMLDFAQDRRFRTALDDAAFMLGDRTEGAAAKAAAHDIDGKADHFPGRDMRLAIARVRRARVIHVVHAIHLVHGQRQRRRIEPHVAFAVRLHHGTRIAGIRFQVEHARGVRIHHRVILDDIVGGQAHDGLVVLFLGHGQALFAAHDADRLDDFGRF